MILDVFPILIIGGDELGVQAFQRVDRRIRRRHSIGADELSASLNGTLKFAREALEGFAEPLFQHTIFHFSSNYDEHISLDEYAFSRIQ